VVEDIQEVPERLGLPLRRRPLIHEERVLDRQDAHVPHQPHEVDLELRRGLGIEPEILDVSRREGQTRVHREANHLFRGVRKLPDPPAVRKPAVQEAHSLEEGERLRSVVQGLFPGGRPQISGRCPALGSHSLNV
jgi:hypothetical protein